VEKKSKKKKKKKEKKGEEDEDEGPSEVFIGRPEAGMGKWASCIRIFDPAAGETTFLMELEDNEAAFSLCTVKFANRDELFLAVGTAKELVLSPTRKFTTCYVHLYKFGNQGRTLEFMHRTETKDVVMAMAPFKGRLLVGVGNRLRIYDLGKKKLLRKCENKHFHTLIQSIFVQGDRIYVGDVAEAFHYVGYNKSEKQLNIFADTTHPRYLTCGTPIDYDTICGGDKFGNVFISRLPSDVSAIIAKDPTGGKLRGAYGELIRPEPYKLTEIVQYHVGELVTSIQKAALVPGFNEVLIYSTLMGSIGIFVPFQSRENVEFFSHLEMHLRQENPPLCGRDHLAFRSYYFPVKDVVDGDLCEQYTSLDYEKQKSIAEELVSTPPEVAKKLEELRNRVL
jgi:splicing factor 3B subunit 3